ncbi:unnamed protein product [Agarophyton chilense]|eukprot:gb/GEZJ01002162.1/.p1 GENE.gb/GEZJ01002162.1/~~gb/GEZJ01002162.1/.p1  ORF type:complete len:261 (+),score=40.11 gb/GEZJ01002162.1/:169-951(+)
MVVCRYFREGRCRYGDSCKFEHRDPRDDVHLTNDPFVATSSKPNRSHKQQHDSQPQWPLSVIGSRDDLSKGNELTGDISPEELRALAYSLAARGVSPQVVQKEGEMVSDHRAKVDALSRGGMQTHAPLGSNTIQMRDPFVGGDGFSSGHIGHNNSTGMPMEHEQHMGNPFNAQPAGNPFGQAAPFGQQQQQASPFQQQHQPATPFQQPAPFEQPAGQSMPQNATQTTPPQNITPAQEQQFSAPQFGFANVPETAPPPRFY